MMIVTIFKWAVNPQDARVSADGSVDWSAARPEVGDDDHAAAQVGRSAADPDGEMVGLTLAGGDVAFCAARGSQRTIVIDGLPSTADAQVIASALVAAVRSLGTVDVVVIGDSSWEPSVPPLLAGLLGWPALMAVDSVERREGSMLVSRRFGSGTQDVAVKGPVVLGVAARREEENKPGMRDVLNARKKPIATVTLTDLGVEGSPSLASAGTRLPESASSRLFDGSDPERAVGQLVQALQSEGAI